jgi:hypothetical protein
MSALEGAKVILVASGGKEGKDKGESKEGRIVREFSYL